MSKIDLHIHSNASDGRFSPAELVRQSVTQGLAVISICDHDTVNGIPAALEAGKNFPQLRVIPGVEISTDVDSGEVHVLGYFIDYTNQELEVALESFRNSRKIRAQKMIAKLRELGININWERVKQIAGDSAIGRPHIAQAMLEKGYITALKEAFAGYIGFGGPAYVPREKMTPVESVKLILRADGLPVLAHPFTIDNTETMIVELKVAGLVGLESYYDSYTREQIKSLVSLAKKYKLIATGGSDYHGLDVTNETLLGAVEVPTDSAEQLIALAKQRGLRLAS